MKTQMIIRVDQDTKERFERLTRAHGKNSSEVVRELMAAYVVESDLGAWVDRVWDRIGARMQSKGYRRSDVGRAVRDVRRAQR